jgi:anhydro-N-acetylmuramic acid kinase
MKKPCLILGLMSGTSHDGVDAALVSIRGSKIKLIRHCHFPYPPALRKKISSAFTGNASDICRLNFELGEVFARAAVKCIKASGVNPGDVTAIASHGQTICHHPPEKNKKGSTLQIGESAVIAQRTGIPVVSDFRVADMAAGGEGAPLVPYADYMLFHGKGIKAVHNIGGISNVTVVTPDIENVFAFDTGPGNCLIDEAMKTLFKKPFDRDGKTAKKGTPDKKLLRKLLSNPYFKKKPPKSTGRETFGRELLNKILKSRLASEDLIATLTHFTALSIKDAYDRFVFPGCKIDEIVLSGGGTKNKYLVGIIRELFSPVKVSLIDDYGIPAQAKEALSFAVLANETLSGKPSNLPMVTGASKKVILGKLTLPS